MTRAICNQYIKENDGKVSVSDLKSSTHNKQMNLGEIVLVYFPEGSGSKLIPNWKGLYIIKEQLDKNTYAVCLQGNERKKFIVHKSRLRPVRTHLAEQNVSAPENLERAKEDSIPEIESNEHIEEKIPQVREQENNKVHVPEATLPTVVPERSSRPKRQAADKARLKMKKMK